jgi:hypothetical protein
VTPNIYNPILLIANHLQAALRSSCAGRFAVCISKTLNAQLARTATHHGIAWFSVGIDKL